VTDLAAAKAKPLKGDAAPDLEEAYDVDEEVPEEEPENDDGEVELTKNKLVKEKKPKGAKTAAKGKGKAKA
jgi:replication factor C subunit 1